MKRFLQALILTTLAHFSSSLNSSCLAAEVTSQRLIQAEKEPHNWLSYSGTYNAWRYSPLDQINKNNLKKLVPVWAFQTGKTDGGFSCTPLVADGVMYITSPWNRVFALNAVTGKEIWHYYYPVPKEFGLIYGPWNRGVALGHGLVFMERLTTIWWPSTPRRGRKSGT
jgi:alcohol dehydrogenase (cytochrome c)